MKLALAQINPTVGDLEGNSALVARVIEEAQRAGADLVAFPELAISGYPPEDLLLKSHFVRDCAHALAEAATAKARPTRKVTLTPLKTIPRTIAMAPTTKAEILPALIFCWSDICRFR